MTRPFRFGVQASLARSGHEWMDMARRAEGHGYSTLTMPDHFANQFAPMPALSVAAAVTQTLRVGALVFANDYKHPVVLAKELATLDVLSGGRVEVGIGAGWMHTDYEQSGIPFDGAGIRIDRMVEAIAVLRGAFAGEVFTFSGEHYTVRDYKGRPLPVQRPGPPLLIGGGGPRMLAVAAREADIVGINPRLDAGVVGPEAFADMGPVTVDRKVALVREAAGARMDAIELNIRAFIVNVTDDKAQVIRSTAELMGVAPADLEASPYACVGTPAQIVDDLRARGERWGFSYVVVGAEDIEPFAPVVAELAGT